MVAVEICSLSGREQKQTHLSFGILCSGSLTLFPSSLECIFCSRPWRHRTKVTLIVHKELSLPSSVPYASCKYDLCLGFCFFSPLGNKEFHCYAKIFFFYSLCHLFCTSLFIWLEKSTTCKINWYKIWFKKMNEPEHKTTTGCTPIPKISPSFKTSLNCFNLLLLLLWAQSALLWEVRGLLSTAQHTFGIATSLILFPI